MGGSHLLTHWQQEEIEIGILGSKDTHNDDDELEMALQEGGQRKATGCCNVLWSLLRDRTVVLVTLIYAIFSFGVIGFDGACQV